MKPIASFFLKRERKSTSLSYRIITPTQALAASGAAFLIALWPLLSLHLGQPTSWFGQFLFLLCATVSIFVPASLSIATFIDVMRRRSDTRTVAAFVVSLAGVAAIAAYIYLRIHKYYAAA